MPDMTNTSTNDTTPATIWVHEVVMGAGVSVEDMENYCGRDRVLRWYNAGEPVWMAADSLRTFVRNGKRHERADREIDAMHAHVRTGAKS